MKPSYIVLGFMEIITGVLIIRHQERLVARLKQSWRPFPVNEEWDKLVMYLVGPMAIFIGVVTAILGLA